MTRLDATQLLDLAAKARKTAREAVRYQHDAAAQADDEALRPLIGWVHEHIDAEDEGRAPGGSGFGCDAGPEPASGPASPKPACRNRGATGCQHLSEGPLRDGWARDRRRCRAGLVVCGAVDALAQEVSVAVVPRVLARDRPTMYLMVGCLTLARPSAPVTSRRTGGRCDLPRTSG
jgi:hypothetical protein